MIVSESYLKIESHVWLMQIANCTETTCKQQLIMSAFVVSTFV